ncbi:MAG TPA: M3 family oligoendopeptidase [Phycisphaerales bacterium]|jgi:oligoendopeptidase F|nr:M3 family oligoendopeptidase [Phycisphaerales bacterium]
MKSSFLKVGFDGASWTQIEPLVEQLKSRPVSSAADLERWLLDRSDLEAACSEARANLYIATSCNTEDKAVEAAYTRYLDEVGPRLEVAGFELDKRQVDLHEHFPLDPERYEVMERSKRASVELFREENVPIQTELAKLSQEHGKITGSQTVVFDGQERTLPQMAQYQLRPDRAVRESAWRAVADRRLKDRAAMDELLDKMVERRDRMARNAACAGYVEYAFKSMQRFDYTPADCRVFWNAVEKHVVPLVRRLDAQRAGALGLGGASELRPWDLSVDPKGRAGLKPFDGGRELMRKTRAVMEALDTRLGRMTARLGSADEGANGSKALITECLDLDSRKGKRPGGYQYVRDLSRKPFIFMNAAGLHKDVMTMVHEAGHAFHSMLAENEPLVEYRHSPIEFAEVASMSMEHLTMAHWGVRGGFYDKEEDLRRARREHLEDSISILAWIATIDAFQHWMYANPKHTHAQRDAHWLALDQRFGHALDWSGLEPSRQSLWQRQGHLYSHPMYYIEYGIAQLGALGLWLKGRREGEKAAVDAYVRALTLGGSRPLPELFKTAGLKFDFGEGPVAGVVEAVEGELATLRD